MPVVVKTSADTSVDVPIPVRVSDFVAEVALSAARRSLVSLQVVFLTTDFRFCFPVEVCVFFLMYPTWTAGGGVVALNSGSG